MTAQRGSLVLIKVGNAGEPETFTTLGGLRVSLMTLNQRQVEAATLESGAWRRGVPGVGIRSMTLSGRGIFTDAASEEMVRAYAFAGSVNNYRFLFANGDYVTGAFQIVSYERAGDHDGEENYALTLESAGPVSFTAG